MANYTLVPVYGNKIRDHYGDDIFDGLVAHQPHLFDNVEFQIDDPDVPFAGNVQLANGKFVYIVEPSKHGFVVKKQYREDPDEKDPVLREWGDYKSFDMSPAADIDLQDWLKKELMTFGRSLNLLFPTLSTHKVSELPSDICRLNMRLRAFNPRRSKQYEGKITVYMSHEHRDNGREVAMKPGRALSLMFPELEHRVIIQLTNEFLQKFTPRTFTVHTASDAESFRLAYAGVQTRAENITTSSWRKHLAHSCMRYDFEHLPIHPAEAYASGDFDIIYLTDKEGLIGGRCVVYKNHVSGLPQPGPVYGVSEQAIDLIMHQLETIGAKASESSCWVGARLARHDYDGGFIAPYLDLTPQCLEESECGRYLVVHLYGEIDASQYDGVLGSMGTSCSSCGHRLPEDDCCYSEYTDLPYCYDCYHDEHYYCEWAEEFVHESQTATAFTWRDGRRCQETVALWVLESGNDFVMCSDEEYWHVDCAHYCECRDEYISSADLKNFFWSEWDSELYPIYECVDVVDEHGDTQSVSEEEARDAGYVLDNDSGLWIKGESKDV